MILTSFSRYHNRRQCLLFTKNKRGGCGGGGGGGGGGGQGFEPINNGEIF